MARKVFVLRKRGTSWAWIIALAAILGALAVTNPDTADFKDFQIASESKKVGSSILGNLGGSVQNIFYERSSYVFFSIFKPKFGNSSRYLGLLKGLFIKLGA